MLHFKQENPRAVPILAVRQESINPLLFLAFGVALVLHLAPFLLFRIASYSPLETYSAKRPSQVTAEIPDRATQTDAFIEREVPLSFPFTPPKSLSPSPPSIELMLSDIGSHQTDPLSPKALAVSPKSFKPVYYQYFKEYSPIKIKLSGPVTALEIKPLQVQAERTIKHLSRHLIRFSVKVDPLAGEVIWYAPIQLSKKQKLNLLAENVLLALKFTQMSDLPLLDGEVAIEWVTADD